MRIIELKAENIKRLKAVEIKPKDNVVVISGKNDQGKTSILDSIWYALSGKSSLRDTPVPIRKSESYARATLDLGDFIVTRKWTGNDKTYLEVTSKDGAVYKTPQQLIDSFVGKLSFDPLEFAQLKEDKQRELLLGLIDLDIDLDHIDTKISVLYDQRRLKGREVKLLEGQREDFEEGLPEKLVSISELQTELERLFHYNSHISEQEEKLKNHKDQLEILQGKVKEVKKAINELEKHLKDKKQIDTTDIKNQIDNAETINEKIRARERSIEANNEYKKARNEYDNYTKQIEDLVNTKVKALEKAKMPIRGLGIDDTGVTYNELPFSQLSSSEQLKVSMAIAMAFNPKLRVIRITDGSLLDDDNMKIVEDMAKDKDFQVWIEKVDGSGKVGFYIEDGEVKHEN